MEKANYPNPIIATNIAKNLNYFNTTTIFDAVFMRLIAKLILLNIFITYSRNKPPSTAAPKNAK